MIEVTCELSIYIWGNFLPDDMYYPHLSLMQFCLFYAKDYIYARYLEK